jgi:hypothetical protein
LKSYETLAPAPLRTLDWQVHVYGSATAEIRAHCVDRRLALHEFPWTPATERAGLARNALYLVRPDWYVALASSTQSSQRSASALAGLKVSESESRSSAGRRPSACATPEFLTSAVNESHADRR